MVWGIHTLVWWGRLCPWRCGPACAARRSQPGSPTGDYWRGYPDRFTRSALVGLHQLFSLDLIFAGLVAMPLQDCIEMPDQCCSVERLGQEADRSGIQRPPPPVLIGESRDENDRKATTLGQQVTLQLDTAHPGHLNVRNNTGRVVRLGRGQELLGRRKRASDVSKRPHEPVGRDANRRVIVNDRNHRSASQRSIPCAVRKTSALTEPRYNGLQTGASPVYLGLRNWNLLS